MDYLQLEYLKELARYPHNAGTLENSTHSHEEHNPLCGDVVRIDLLVNDEGIIDEVAFTGRGCTLSQASASLLTDMIKDKTLDEAKQISKEDILEALGIDEIGPARIKCALLSLKVLKAGAYGLSEEEWNTDDNW